MNFHKYTPHIQQQIFENSTLCLVSFFYYFDIFKKLGDCWKNYVVFLWLSVFVFRLFLEMDCFNNKVSFFYYVFKLGGIFNYDVILDLFVFLCVKGIFGRKILFFPEIFIN